MKIVNVFLLLVGFFLPLTASAGEFKVFGVRSDFPMADGQPAYRDLYVNMGTDQGIKTGSTLDAFRVVTTVDELNQKTGQNIVFKIAHLKVVHAESDIAVARVVEFLRPDSMPLANYTNVMVGDQVEVGKK